jgi:hypothetical protein
MNIDRLNNYDKDHCWQYDIRLKNYEEDLVLAGLTDEYVKTLKVPDFDFKVVTNKSERKELKAFIERHEWLGNLSQFTTHWFGCYHKDILAGVILFNVPNTFSKMLGENTPHLERLISRGACISWSPKNLASSMLMWSIQWMVDNTDYRLFTAYSDPTAKELGTIYQACNFYYLGQKAGTTKRYINPYTGKMVSDRYFRQKTAYRKYAKEMGIEWGTNWNHSTGMSWENIPDDIETKLRDYSKKKQLESKVTIFPQKHKYAYILGRDKRETKHLKRKFENKIKTYPYPKDRN